MLQFPLALSSKNHGHMDRGPADAPGISMKHMLTFIFARKYPGIVLVACLLAPVTFLSAGPYAQGKAAYSRGNFSQAHDAFQKALKANPSNGNAAFYIASMLDRKGKKGQAIRYYRKAVAGKLDSDLREKAYWKLVLYYRYHRDWDNLAAYSSRFLAFRKIGKVEGFLAEAERNRDPTRAAMARHMRAAQEQQAAGDLSAAAGSYRRALALKSNDSARWELANILMKQKRYSEARSHLKRLVLSDGSRWAYHYKLGVTNYHLGDSPAALTNFKNARERNKEPGKDFRYFLGVGEGLALLSTGQHARAREALRSSAAVRTSPTVLSALGRSEFWLGRMAQAEQYARQAIAKKPGDADAYMTLGLVQNYQGKKRAALDSLKKMDGSLNEAKKKPLNYHSPGYLILGSLASLAKEHALSLRALDRVDRGYLRGQDLAKLTAKSGAFQPDPVYDYYYGKGLLETGRSRESLTYLRKIKPTPGVSYLIARAHGEQNDLRATRKELSRVFEAKPELRQRAMSEPVFRKLANRDTGFLLFLEDREPPPETTPSVANQNNPGSDSTPATTKPAETKPVAKPVKKPVRRPVRKPVDITPIPGAPKLPELDLEG